MTRCRDLKEQHCYVAQAAQPWGGSREGGRSGLSLNNRLALGNDSAIPTVSVDLPHVGMFELGRERVLVPEALFDAEIGSAPTLPQLIVRCAQDALAKNLCGPEAVRALLRNIVLVGGAADLPGIRPRTEFEVRELLRRGAASKELLEALESPDDVFVLNPPLGEGGPLTSPRFAPYIGGCVRGVSSGAFQGVAGRDPSAANGHFLGINQLQRMATTGSIVPGIALWVRQRLFDLNAPAVFRTGGGGGEDDLIGGPWDEYEEEVDDHEENEEEDEHEETEEEDDQMEASSQGHSRTSGPVQNPRVFNPLPRGGPPIRGTADAHARRQQFAASLRAQREQMEQSSRPQREQDEQDAPRE
eukprot:gnl/TRDRNA2_/TRDRNA2_161561_c1_seq1.p1 gnl/TRDRNA2_/TRDRNA2_161561_c1~~gnl/TRDRNA2_/TRDRNA2_161561_c1_seq1.p1  ORF type:complete len:358 (+),score=54.75 gnl/TRDRNA2_/TRDRNA2_161561_c1_seq1:2-1075(+)